MSNEQLLIKSNAITYHESGFTGKRAHIVVLDGNTDGHIHGSSSVPQVFAPDAKIVHFRFTTTQGKQDAYEYIEENKDDIDIINASLGGTSIASQSFLPLEKYNIPIIAASGNNGNEDRISYPARYEWTIAIGAYNNNLNTVASYSNGGAELDAVAFTNVRIINLLGYEISFSGTSCAAPTTSGLLALVADYRKSKGLPRLNTEQTRQFIYQNCIDKYEKGFDYRSGWGLFILPPFNELEKELSHSEIPLPNPLTPPIEEDGLKQPAQFTDIQNHWAKSSIGWVSATGFMNDYPDQTFKPSQPVSRLEFALILSRLDEVKNSPFKVNNINFIDYQQGDKYYSVVEEVCRKGYLGGYTDGIFSPNEILPREQLAIILMRLSSVVNMSPVNQAISFKDVVSHHWAKNSITNVQIRNVMNGVSHDEFGVGKPVTRAEIAVILYRLFK
ncbi:S8 family peptidase [Halalkalibacter oceani]|uniref:S8 family peptidase n=1 Tax=Halalkalibacter oceani TaxID=1653776 RepID=UPI003391B5C4